MTITHDSLDLTVQRLLQTWDLTLQGHPPPDSDIWWLSLETCSNLLKHVLWPQAGGRHPTGMLSCYVFCYSR